MSSPNNLPATRPVADQLALARELASSQLLPRQYQKNPANLLYAIQYAEAIAVHPIAAVTGIHVIEGKPTASAQLIGGLVRRAGHVLRVRFDRASMTASATIIRADDPDFAFESVWTMDRARSANLANKAVWKQYPDAMLKARAITEVARDACPEALFGIIYTPEELGAEVAIDGDGDQVPVNVGEATTPAPTVAASAVKNKAFQTLVDAGVERDDAIAAVAAAWDAAGYGDGSYVTFEQGQEFLAGIADVAADQTTDAEVVEEDDDDPFAIGDDNGEGVAA
jgi:hypothetical protein